MRMLLASLLLLAACGKGPTTGDDDMMMPDAPDTSLGPPAFEIMSPDVTLQPNQEVTYCYYFHTPNTATVNVNKWVSDMTPGSHHMIFFTGGATHADGLDTTNSCGFGGSFTNISKWVYASQVPHQEEDLPGDDGTGKPLAQLIAPNTAGAFQMHYLNISDSPLVVHVDLKAYALAAGTAFTQTDAFITYNQDISIPPHATNYKVTATCDLGTKLPSVASAKFWTVSTHAHKQAIETDIWDATAANAGTATPIFKSNDWEHPGSQNWMTTPFYTLSSHQLTWNCTYNNTGDNQNSTITSGQSAQTNEMCMATGYFFPADGPHGCLEYGGSCYCQ
jgi:hypothetical protein